MIDLSRLPSWAVARLFIQMAVPLFLLDRIQLPVFAPVQLLCQPDRLLSHPPVAVFRQNEQRRNSFAFILSSNDSNTSNWFFSPFDPVKEGARLRHFASHTFQRFTGRVGLRILIPFQQLRKSQPLHLPKLPRLFQRNLFQLYFALNQNHPLSLWDRGRKLAVPPLFCRPLAETASGSPQQDPGAVPGAPVQPYWEISVQAAAPRGIHQRHLSPFHQTRGSLGRKPIATDPHPHIGRIIPQINAIVKPFLARSVHPLHIFPLAPLSAPPRQGSIHIVFRADFILDQAQQQKWNLPPV